MSADTDTDAGDDKPSIWKRMGGFLGRHGKTVARGSAVAAGTVVGAAAFGAAVTAKRGIMALRGNMTWLLLFIVAVLHFINITQGAVTLFSAQSNFILTGFILAGLFAGLFVYRSDNGAETLVNTAKFVGLGVATYAFPVIIAYFREGGYINREIAALLILCTPVLGLYILMNPGDRLTGFLAAAYFVVLFFYILASMILPNIGTTGSSISGVLYASPAEAWMDGKRVVLFFTTETVDTGTAIYNTTRDIATGNIKQAAPELFIGQVDRTEGPPLGVFHANGRPLYDRFRVDLTDPIITTTEIRSRTLSQGSGVPMDHVCWFQTPDPLATKTTSLLKVDGTVSPPATILSYSGDVQDVNTVECQVENKKLAALGFPSNLVSGDIVMNTTFPFSTSGYVTYAFMERNLYETYRQQNKDPAKEMGIKSGRQVAKYTPGPVGIGMPSESLPIPYSEDTATIAPIPPLGLTFSSTQVSRGGIQSFESVRVFIPVQFELGASAKCSPSGVVVSEVTPSSMGTAYREYEIKNVLQPDRDYASGITVRCPMTVSAAQRDSVLGPTGTALFTVLVQANYTFSVDSRVPVVLTVKPMVKANTILGGSPNLAVADDVTKCKTATALCDELSDTSSCACFYRLSATDSTAPVTLGACTWPRKKGEELYTNYGKDGFSCQPPTKVPAACATQSRCSSKGACTCSLFVQGEQLVYYWRATDPTSCTYEKCTPSDEGIYSCGEKLGGSSVC